MRFFLIGALSFLVSMTPVRSDVASHEELRIDQLRCEYLQDPEGIDVRTPRLRWRLSSDRRGERQTAYRILVASSTEILSQNRGDLWDSGKVPSAETAQIEYGGLTLTSRQPCVWKVMTWDKAGHGSAWSEAARWSMGLLEREDWQAQWITDAILADPANRPLTPIHCYRSELASSPNVRKWIALDLGTSQAIDSIDLIPARPPALNPDFRTVMFPVHFQIEVADDAAFSNPRLVVDQTKDDFAPPRTTDCLFKFPVVTARFVRLIVTKLACWDAGDYGLALGGLTVNAGDKLVSGGAQVSCSDSLETSLYSRSYLGQNKRAVALAPDSKAVIVDFPGVPLKRTVSRVPMLRRDFTLDGTVKRATLYVTARGFYECHLNGQRVGDHLLDPGYTDCAKRIQYQTFDVTGQVHPGQNAIGVLLGYGWYAGHMNLFENRCINGFFPLLLAQLEVEMADGRQVTLGTDGQWRTTLSGAIRWSDLLDGEGYDCRLETMGWDQAGFDDHDWRPAYSQQRDQVALVAPLAQPVRVIQTMRPVSMKEVKAGVYVYDLGQEITGYCRLKADGVAGQKITLRHGESVAPDGGLSTSNLWGVAAEEDYILDGKGTHVLEPHFTYHGFRYVEVTGLPQPPAFDALVAINIHTDAATIGEFTCSNDLYNRMMSAVRWTQWNMLFDVPAGCAGRSERLAWLGDIRPCVQTAMCNMDTGAFFHKYSIDIRDEQTADGRYCDITPHAHLQGTSICVGSPGWADAGVSLPWQEYVNLGDLRLLQEHYDSAKRWVDFVHGKNPNLLWEQARGSDWGDWLSGGVPSTPKDLGATAFFAHSTDLVSRMAQALGRQEDAARYHELFDQIRLAFAKAYIRADGTIGNDAEGNYALALQFELLDESLRPRMLQHLLDAIHRANGHPTTGFWSSVEMLLALSDNGANDEAARMINLRTEPSWGYMLDHSTTYWESFDANTKNRSLNHWTHSAIGEWLWKNVAGINPDPDKPGYQSIIIRPRPSKEVTSCRASYDSIRGTTKVQWLQESEKFTLDVTIPAGATAEVYLPTRDRSRIEESGARVDESENVQFLRSDKDTSVFKVDSGSYSFVVNSDSE